EAQRALTERFLVAAHTGDMQALTSALAADVIFIADGGADVLAARRPVQGSQNVARLLLGGFAKVYAGTVPTIEALNGGIAVVLWRGDVPVAVTTILTADGQ